MKKLLIALLLLSLLAGCAARENAPVQTSFFAMNTSMSATVYGDSAAAEEVQALILSLEKQLSVTDPDSAVYAINRDGTGALDGEGALLLDGALDLCRRTEGALDLSIYPVVRAWGFTTGDYRIPTGEELAGLLPLVDYSHIGWDGTTVTLEPGMEIDLGSVAKGFAGQQAARLLRERGVTSALLSLGGNIQAIGSKPDGSPWKIGVRDPFGEDSLLVLSVRDKAVVTSGGYERYFEQDGKTYWHIMDPDTGCPAESGLRSVTVVAEDGLLCDGLSTALFVMGLDRASEFWSESRDFEAIFITDDGTVWLTKGLRDAYTLAPGHEDTAVELIF